MPHLIETEPDEYVSEPSAASGMGKAIFLLLLLGAGVFFGVKWFGGPKNALADWGHDWDEMTDAAQHSNKPMLVLFTADWCPPCQSLKSDVLGDEAVAKMLKENFTLLKIDLTQQGGPGSAIAQNYGVRGIPTMMVFSPKGRQVDRISGLGPKAAMVQWIEAAGQRARNP